jgi:two-component system nitrogen regulation response regulator NtrX
VPRASVLLIDDEPNILKTVRDNLRVDDYAVEIASSGAAGLAKLDEHDIDVVLLDVMMPGETGLEVLPKIREKHPDVAVIMLSGNATFETAVQATKLGAIDFLEKPPNPDKIRLTIENALKLRRLAREDRKRRAEFAMVGKSSAMRAIFDKIAKTAPTTGRVLITGENGTGKELVARAIHDHSKRADGPFVYVNCVALADELIESTLFGHEKGAFTGAIARKEGRLEAAHGGTAFLDEIGDVSARLQAKLLHFLETGEFERVGGTRTLRVDCRVVAATNRDLPRAVREGGFREDLYYRLNVIGLHLPPLRERREDVPRLAEEMLRHYAAALKRPGLRLAPATLAALEAHAWPGNVRQLKNAIERMAVLADGDELGPELLPPELAGDARSGAAGASGAGAASLDLREAVEAFRRAHIARVLAQTGGNRTRAAELLGIQRTHLSLLLKAKEDAAPDDAAG